MYVCEASQLLLQNGQGFTKLIKQIYDQIKQIFEVNSVLVNTLDPILHKCCNPVGGFVQGVACLSRFRDDRIRTCFKGWAKNLKRKIRRPNNEFLSYLFGEGECILQISDHVSMALKNKIIISRNCLPMRQKWISISTH